MAKRLTDTDKWKKDWFINLNNSQKLLWFYILDSCDHAGICDFNEKLFSFHLNEKWSKDKINNAISCQITWIGEKKFIVNDFVKFQYGLNSSMIKTVKDKFSQVGIDFDTFFSKKIHSPPTVSLAVGQSVPDTIMVMEEEMVMEMVMENKMNSESNKKPITPREKLDQIVDVWRMAFENTKVPLVKHINKKRENLFNEALKDLSEYDDWVDAILGLRSSDFHLGENERGWVADFDYFLNKNKKVYLTFSEKYKNERRIREENENIRETGVATNRENGE